MNRECPYCQRLYRIEESLKHLTTRECLAAQRALDDERKYQRAILAGISRANKEGRS